MTNPTASSAAVSDDLGGTFSWAARDYRTGAVLGENADAPVPTAGVDRLALYLAVQRAASAGRLDLGAETTYREEHRRGHEAGIIRWMSPGLELSLADALAQMIITGDGVSTAIVHESLRAAGLEPGPLAQELCADLGLERTVLGDAAGSSAAGVDAATRGVTTPREQLRLLESLLAAAGLGEAEPAIPGLGGESAAATLKTMRSVLKKAGIPGRLPGYGPYFVDVAHLCCDGGNGDAPSADWADDAVVFDAGRPQFAVAAFCTGVPEMVGEVPGEESATGRLAELGRRLLGSGPFPAAAGGGRR